MSAYKITQGHDPERPDCWWVLGFRDCGPLGPYATKSLAIDDARGVDRFYKNNAQLWEDRLDIERDAEESLGCLEQGELF